MIRKTTISIVVLLFGAVISLPLALVCGCAVMYESFMHLWRGLFEIIKEQCRDEVSHEQENDQATGVWERHQQRLDETARKETKD